MTHKMQTIGLLGGSFNPAHEGHLHSSLQVLKALKLDSVWWLVSPQNPLKPEQPSWDSRAETVRNLPLPPHMRVSDVELRYGTQYTVDLLKTLRMRERDTRFVFMLSLIHI